MKHREVVEKNGPASRREPIWVIGLGEPDGDWLLLLYLERSTFAETRWRVYSKMEQHGHVAMEWKHAILTDSPVRKDDFGFMLVLELLDMNAHLPSGVAERQNECDEERTFPGCRCWLHESRIEGWGW